MKLEVYTIRDCEFCRELKDTLLLEKIEYTEIPIEQNWRVRIKQLQTFVALKNGTL